MDVNLSLDEIIKKSKSKKPVRRTSKSPGRPMRLKSPRSRVRDARLKITPGLKDARLKISPGFRDARLKTSPGLRDARLKISRGLKDARLKISPGLKDARMKITPILKDARLKISPNVQDARLKISQNKNRLNNRSPLVGKNVLVDARLKIEAHKQKKLPKPLFQQRKSHGITTIGGDGIIERRISANTPDNGIRVEYEDDEMDLEYDSLQGKRWEGESFLVRRTIQNNERKKTDTKMFSMHDDRAYDQDVLEHSQSPFYENPQSFKEVTRTIPNSSYKEPSTYPDRKPYSRRSPAVEHYKYEDDRKIRPTRSTPSYKSPLTKGDSSPHLIVISNLHENVTGEDIKELFEDVGALVYAKMIRDGVAEVAYESESDAQEAVKIYHNRLLDGLPMQCFLVSDKRDSSTRKIPALNTFSPVEPDTHLIKKALFSSH